MAGGGPSLTRGDREERVRSTHPGGPGLAVCLTVLTILVCAGQALDAERGNGEAPAVALTVEDSIALVLRNNRQLVNARLGRVAQTFALQVAENKFRPHVVIGPYFDQAHVEPSPDTSAAGVFSKVTLRIPTGAEIEVDWRVGGRDRNTPSQPRYFNEVELKFTQPLLRGAGQAVNTASIRTARLIEEINVLALKQTIIDVVSSVVRSYRGYGQAERRVDIRANSLERARELLAINELLVQTGRMAERDIVQTQADIASRELQLIAARNRLDAARLTLIDILDIDSRTRLRLTDSLDVEDNALQEKRVQTDVRLGVEAALRHRPDYQAALLGIRNAETRVTEAGNGQLWDLSVTLSAGFAHADGTLGGTVSRLDDADYGIRLDLGILMGPGATGPEKLAYVQAVTDLKIARNNLADLRQRIDIEVSNAVREVELSARQVALARTARQLFEEKMEIEREKLRLGLSSNFQLVAFEDDLVAAQNRELDSIIAYLDALTSLDRTLGTTLDTWGIDIGSANEP